MKKSPDSGSDSDGDSTLALEARPQRVREAGPSSSSLDQGTIPALGEDLIADATANRIRAELGADQSGRFQSDGKHSPVLSITVPEGPRGNPTPRTRLDMMLFRGDGRPGASLGVDQVQLINTISFAPEAARPDDRGERHGYFATTEQDLEHVDRIVDILRRRSRPSRHQ